jgi:hypothetical protein
LARLCIEPSLWIFTLGIQQHDLSDLEMPFTAEEVWSTLKEIPLDKAPGPDGFTGRFYKVCWDVKKVDVLDVMCGRTCARRARDVRRGTERAARTQEGKASG